ncbi:hypothetical protein ABID81_002972 [Frigoribacterium sp. PvP054]|uniref:hypothetical protein n=1 Tax=Frigoribacterium sp. PvP054 TaxID=3156438 RepID=UPI003394A7B4
MLKLHTEIPSPKISDGRGRPANTDYAALASKAKAHPGIWVESDRPAARGISTAIERGGIKAFPAGEFEASLRQVGKGDHGPNHGVLYVRYVGQKVAA